MQTTRLILIEGLSCSGKSTMAHYLSRQLTKQGIPHTWWYEENKGHPLYSFHDPASMQQVIDTLATGDHDRVIAVVLELWQQLVESLQASENIAILDGSLFGHLTWTLFPFDIPLTEIQAYLTQVERLIRPLNPCLIYLYQDDLATSFRRRCQRRNIKEEDMIRAVTETVYGKRRNLQGFEGMLQYWTDYRYLIDAFFSSMEVAKLSLENSAGDWLKYQQQVLQFLGLSLLPELSLSGENLDHFVGTYTFMDGDIRRYCAIWREQGYLFLDGVPSLWPNNRLIPLSQQVFAVDSFPVKVHFEDNACGNVSRMVMTGPEMLFCSVNYVFVREQEQIL